MMMRKDGRLEGWKTGRMEDWKDGREEGWKIGRLEGRKDGRLEYGQEIGNSKERESGLSEIDQEQKSESMEK